MKFFYIWWNKNIYKNYFDFYLDFETYYPISKTINFKTEVLNIKNDKIETDKKMTQSSIQQNKTSLNKEKVCLECNNPSDFR